MKKIIITILAICSLSVFVNTVFAEQLMLFVMNGCSHCANVEKYLEANDIYSKLDVNVYELTASKENQDLFKQKSEELGYTRGGVPFLVYGTRYVVGDTPIISYIEELLAFELEPEVIEPETEMPEQEITKPEVENDSQAILEQEPAQELEETPESVPALTTKDEEELKNILSANVAGENEWINKNKTYLIIGGAVAAFIATFGILMLFKARRK